MDQLLREFLVEAEELIEALFSDFQRLREKHSEGRARRELTARIFRHAHTLKGTAAAAGLNATSHIAHEFETLLDAIRLGRISLNEAVLDTCDDTVHALSHSLNRAARGEFSDELPLPLLEDLRLLAQRQDGPSATRQSSFVTAARLPEELERSLSVEAARRVREAVAEGQRLFNLTATFELETFDERFRELSAALGEIGELLSTVPGTADAAPGTISFRLLYASETGAAELAARAAPFGSVTVEAVPLESSRAGPEVEAAAERANEGFDAGSSYAAGAAPLATQVRVELGQLDELINGAHELMTETLLALDLAREQSAKNVDRAALDAHAALVQRHFITLEEQLINLRRVPLARALERAARAGRQVARALGIAVDFEIVGGDVRLDKTLVAALSDPLLHLVRNAVGHGIETSLERAGAGKSKRGTVRLGAFAEGDRVRLEISDDGRGIDLDSVARTAIERGLVEADRSVSRQQALRLIFSPGFSTASRISPVSGRGVGLDVVERAVEQVGGEVRVWSEAGQGSTFELTVPVAVALLSALVVSAANFSYCLDAKQISETLVVAGGEVELAGAEEWIEWRDTRLPLVRLRQLLGHPPAAESEDRLHVVILSAMTPPEKESSGLPERVALAVDGWQDARVEVLVRRLGTHGVCWPGVSGAAGLSDGQLALVLNLSPLLEDHLSRS